MMIETQDLTKKFDEFLAVDGVNLNVKAGQVLALLGPNGAGKTTTVRLLTSVLRPSRGWARIAGHNVVDQPAQVRASVGVLTEQHGLYGRMPGDDYLDFFGQIYGMDSVSRRQQRDYLLTQFGLDQDCHRPIAEYSKGMRQKLALARALIHNPPVLLLDEPTSAMDPESARLVRDSISELRSAERAIILCTHNLAEAEELADQIAIIRRGKIVAQGSPSGLKHTLLGPGEFEIHLAAAPNGQIDALLANYKIISKGPNWFRFQTDQPDQTNPMLLRSLLEAGFPVVQLQKVPRSLEQVYLQAINAAEEVEHVS
jgi:ABC-2 type transport system ATP-binding protein